MSGPLRRGTGTPFATDPAVSDAAGGSAQARAAIAAGSRPRRFGAWYVTEHRLRGMASYRGTIIATGIGNPLVYLFALGVGLATLVDRNLDGSSVGDVGYLAFVAPALLATAAVTIASEEFTYPIFGGFKWNPIFFAINAAPISPRQIVDGQLLAVLFRMLPSCVVYYLVMLVFGAVPSMLGWLSILAAVATGMAVGAVLMSYTATLQTDTGQIAMLMRFGLTPMFLFSGTFFPLSQLPVGLQWIGWISPLWHGTELGRVFSYGHAEPLWLTVLHVAYLSAWLVVGWLVSRRVATRRLNK
ncbi:ABC transporter permease [Planctomonas psychrotolerans]|uniref:ABC transporter permease n=1 Tax=Planctomonas psychrotolerans TaxID=2528712 RepID=UPI00123B9FE9|nr:ABC transporter permease [Planctomonas psychrotolerans]